MSTAILTVAFSDDESRFFFYNKKNELVLSIHVLDMHKHHGYISKLIRDLADAEVRDRHAEGQNYG